MEEQQEINGVLDVCGSSKYQSFEFKFYVFLTTIFTTYQLSTQTHDSFVDIQIRKHYGHGIDSQLQFFFNFLLEKMHQKCFSLVVLQKLQSSRKFGLDFCLSFRTRSDLLLPSWMHELVFDEFFVDLSAIGILLVRLTVHSNNYTSPMFIRNYRSQKQSHNLEATVKTQHTENISHITHQLHITIFIIVNIGLYNRRMGTAQSTQRDMSAIKNHDRIGLYRLFEQKDRPHIQLQRTVSSEQVYKSWASQMQRVKQRPQSHMVYLPVRYNYVRTGMCGSGGMLYIAFEQWQNFLKEEIANRRKNHHFYSEEEVWFIFYSLCKLAAIYEPQHSKLGDLHPNNIIVTSEGFLKVITRHSLPNQLNNFQKVVEEINSDVYLSPQEMDQHMITSGVYQVKHPTKADTFSLGITMLEVATLQNCSYLYIRNPLRLSVQKFRSYCNSVKGKYSQLLYNTLMSALELDPRYRKSMFQIYQALKPFAENIQEMKPFKINEGIDKSMSMNVQKSCHNTSNPQQLNAGTAQTQSKTMLNRKDGS